MVKIIPNGNRVVVELVRIEQMGGIMLPEGMQGAFLFRVVDVGEGRRLDNGTVIPVPFKAGDEVMATHNVSMLPPQLYGGKEYAVLDAAMIHAKVERASAFDGIGGPTIAVPRKSLTAHA